MEAQRQQIIWFDLSNNTFLVGPKANKFNPFSGFSQISHAYYSELEF